MDSVVMSPGNKAFKTLASPYQPALRPVAARVASAMPRCTRHGDASSQLPDGPACQFRERPDGVNLVGDGMKCSIELALSSDST